MDSFLDLFDPGTSPPTNSDVWPEDDDATRLPPEPQMGNVEYKLKLINPSKLRFEHLVTQVSQSKLFFFNNVSHCSLWILMLLLVKMASQRGSW